MTIKMEGWHWIYWKSPKETELRFFKDGNSYLCDPKRLNNMKELGYNQITVELLEETISMGPISQYDNHKVVPCVP